MDALLAAQHQHRCSIYVKWNYAFMHNVAHDRADVSESVSLPKELSNEFQPLDKRGDPRRVNVRVYCRCAAVDHDLEAV